MIKLKRMGDGFVYINERYIESIEVAPDTTIKLHNGTTFVVQEDADEVMHKMLEWQRKTHGKK